MIFPTLTDNLPIDWIRERVFFNGLERDDDFARKRLGFAAPNIFVLHLIS